MNISSPSRKRPFWLSLIGLVLALFVFTWGLQYKLSLYNANDHEIPAKLLSKKERPQQHDSQLLTDSGARSAAVPLVTGAALPLFSLILLALCAQLAPVSSLHEEEGPESLVRFAGLSWFFFRPPPTLA